jgi:ribosomal protein S18 acetylase RimI-like enzyme
MIHPRRSNVSKDQRVDNTIVVLDAPAIPGLTFRGFRGEQDYPAMSAVINDSKGADEIEWSQTAEDVARNYRHLLNSDPERDMLFAEVEGQVVGYSRVWWTREDAGTWLYQLFVHLLPEWRQDGLRRAMLHHNERRLREIAAGHQEDGPRFFEAWSSDSETHWTALLEGEGYKGVRYGYSMVRPDLENIPDLPLPENVEVRPVEPEHVPLIWEAAKEAFRDHWGYSEDGWSMERLREWQESPTYDPDIWQVAWDGDQVAGMVQNFVDHAENEEYGRKRGYTEFISVRRPWRRQGLAKALIARSFWVLRGLGMEEAALGVDADNPNGALRLYRSMGFETEKRHTTYRKPLE